MSDNKNINKLADELSKKLGVPSDKIKSSVQSGNVNEILKNSSKNDAKKVEDILKDPEKTKQILNSPQAKAILKLLGENSD